MRGSFRPLRSNRPAFRRKRPARAASVCLLDALSPSHVLAERPAGKGAALFSEYCATCHGSDTTGGKAQARSQAPIAPDLTRIADRRDGVWPMLGVMSIIDGPTRGTQPRAGMPVIAALGRGLEVAFDTGNGQSRRVPKPLVGIAACLESLQSSKPACFAP